MVCVKCGREIGDGSVFCPYCGGKVAGGAAGEAAPIYQADVKGLLKSGTLTVYPDRVEFSTSSVQKSIYNYSALMAVRKGWRLDSIDFITEDGRTESCPVSRKNVHEAFLYIEKAAQPYIAQRNARLLSEGIRYSFISSLGLTGGILNISDDKVEFKGKSGQSDVVSYRDVKAVSLSMGKLEFFLTNGTSKAFAADKELRDDVLAFVTSAIAPYIAERKAALLARGIYYSCLSSCGPGSGTLDILADRAEYTAQTGLSETIFFKDVRAAGLYSGSLELFLTDGTSRSFGVERDVCDEMLVFIQNAIQPYVLARTVDFDAAFGIDERVELNEKRGVFHILRQGGNEITDERPIRDLVKCEWTECAAPTSALALLSGAAKAVGVQGAANAEEVISHVDVVLTVRTDQGEQTQSVCFGNFSLGMSRSNPKYDRYIAEVSRFMDYLGANCPECELIVPAFPEPAPEAAPPAIPADAGDAAQLALAAVGEAEEVAVAVRAAPEKDQLGLAKYIEGVCRFIDNCSTPMTIAIQGSWGSGQNNMMKLLFGRLEERYQENRIWCNAWQFPQPDSDQPLPMLVGKGLIGQLSGANGSGKPDRAVNLAKSIIGIAVGAISQGGADGQDFADALLGGGSPESLEKVTQVFSKLVQQRIGGPTGKVLIFIDGLDKLSPAKGVELLEAMRNFFDCEGCVFVIAADYSSIIRGAQERYGHALGETKGKDFFDKIFQMSFRVPTSGFNVQNYAKDKLEEIGLDVDGGAELGFYVQLIRHSVGCEPKSMDRLFNSFLLLKNMADEELYGNKDRRLMLFSLLCMQTQFHDIYDCLVRMKDKVTPDLLLELCGDRPEVLRDSRLTDDERAAFRDFARVFCDVINADREGGISEEECGVFAEVLDFSSITSK